MKFQPTKMFMATAAVASVAMLGACGSTVGSNEAAAEGDCGTVNLAMLPWTGYTANGQVLTQVLEEELGCEVVQKDLKAEVAFDGFATGEVDVMIENWRPDSKAEVVDAGHAVDMGLSGNKGIIGVYVAPWMAEEYPDITNWENLNKYADLFETSESGGKGQLLDSDPTYVTNDEALIKNLDLDFQVVYAGSEAASIQAFRDAEKNKTPLLAYFWEPHWMFAEVPAVKVNFPEWTEGCDEDLEKVACDYPTQDLDKVARAEWVEAGSPAVDVVKNFNWTNDDQNTVAKYIDADGMTPEEAAAKWIADNPDKVQEWLA